MTQLTDRLNELIRACFTGIWLRSFEPNEALTDMARLCRTENWQLLTWDIDLGLKTGNGSSLNDIVDPLAAVKSLGAMNTGSTENPDTTILVLKNFHRFLTSPEIVQALNRVVLDGKVNRTFVVILAPLVQLPPELERLFIVVEHELPSKAELQALLQSLANEPGELPNEQAVSAVLDASAGLTRYEAENAYSLSLVRHNQVQADAIWELKTQALQKSGLLSLSRSGSDFAALGGLSSLKAFTKRALLRSAAVSTKAKPRGVLLLSPPGCGKSEFCKALGKETGRPVVTLDVGSLMGSLVGQSEERTREALRIIDSMAPCVCMIDELEKAFAESVRGPTAIVGFLLECSGRFSVGSTIMNRMFLWLVPPMTSLSYHRVLACRTVRCDLFPRSPGSRTERCDLEHVSGTLRH